MTDNELAFIIIVVLLGFIYYGLKAFIKKSIDYNFDLVKDKEIEQLKLKLNSELEIIKHQHQLDQVRTSLYFDHQRLAFSKILATLFDVKAEYDRNYDFEIGEYYAISGNSYLLLKDTKNENLLFLDEQCLVSIDLCLNTIQEALPFHIGEETHSPSTESCRRSYEQLDFLINELSELFRSKLSISKTTDSFYKIAILGGVLLLNKYHFSDVGLPTRGKFRRDNFASVQKLIDTGIEFKTELIDLLNSFYNYLNDREEGHFSDVEVLIQVYLQAIS